MSNGFNFHLGQTDDAVPNAGPLSGISVLITRPVMPAARTAQRLASLGAMPLVFPTLIIEPLAEQSALKKALACASEYHIAIFISPGSVEMTLAPFASTPVTLPASLQVITPGPGTAEELLRLGVRNVQIPDEQFDSEGMLNLTALQTEQVRGKRIVIFRGENGRDQLPDTLRERGAAIDVISSYRRRAPTTPPDGLLALLRNRQVNVISAMSSDALSNLSALVPSTEHDALLRTLPLYVSHERIAATALTLGFRNIITTQAGDAGLITALLANAAAL